MRDGQECIDYLSKCSEEPLAHSFPDLVFLDIKMPRADGHDVLAWLSTQPSLKGIPVVVMSGSVREENRRRSLAAGAKAYFTKPTGLEQMREIVKECRLQWLEWRDADRLDGAKRRLVDERENGDGPPQQPPGRAERGE